jgi:peptidoglycan/xylan/chitin deacetylase (PgdA/CDA1 family)
MFEKHVERWRALGPRAALQYYVGTALLERAGVEIVRVFVWAGGDAFPEERAGDTFDVVHDEAGLSARDRELLAGYGGAPLWATFQQAFRDGWRCVIARAQGELACVCWLAETSGYEPANRKRCWVVQRCFTLPGQRGRAHYQRALRFSAVTIVRADPTTPIMIESSIWNPSSVRGIEKAGFHPVGNRLQLWAASQFFPREGGGVRPYRQLVKHGLEAIVPDRLLMTHAPTKSGAVHLTFDDGPHPEHTPALLDQLRTLKVRATFFVIGANAERHPEIVRRMAQEGHAVGSHSFTHSDPGRVSAADLMEEIERTSAVLTPLVGEAPRLFRPPLGAVTAAKLARLWAAGQQVVLWNVDPRDYALDGAEELSAWFDSYQLSAGEIVLLHDTMPYARVALPRLVASVRARGLDFATLGN